MKHNISRKIRCPYYKWNAQQLNHCNGITDATAINLTFANAVDAKDYRSKYCKFEFDKCPIARMLEEIEVNKDA